MDENGNLLELTHKISQYYLIDETLCVSELRIAAELKPEIVSEIEVVSSKLITQCRQEKSTQETLEAFTKEYSLSSVEGVILMCLAEALLRIPDDLTADRLISSKLAIAEFEKHLGNSHSLFVNASTWGLMLTGKIVDNTEKTGFTDYFSSLIGRIGEPMIRIILKQAMKVMASQYIMGNDIQSALARSKNEFSKNSRFSFDMLGESAISKIDATRYLKSYKNAITDISQSISNESKNADERNPSISIKLSALHPRYEYAQRERVLNELFSDLLALVQYAKLKNVAVTLDAEEADRLELSLELFERLMLDESLQGWNGLGLAVQAYQKRALPVLEWLNELANATKKIIPVRLVKGAYWDTEIKRAQEQGLSGYPVFTRKCSTDISYIACVKYLLNHTEKFYPQFATHNAHTIAVVKQFATKNAAFEFQRLHGMGSSLYYQLKDEYPCRIYSPVGSYQDLLPYLVRRLLENGANSSFVNRIENEDISVESIVQNPVDALLSEKQIPSSRIKLPENIYDDRKNSSGINFANLFRRNDFLKKVTSYQSYCWFKYEKKVTSRPVFNPANNQHIVGYVNEMPQAQLREKITELSCQSKNWKRTRPQLRIDIVSVFSKKLKDHQYELIALCVYEAGKTIKDAVAEIREAIDFCEYYVAQANDKFLSPEVLQGPVGEENKILYQGRGLFVCISPWNFPMAIFVGQIVAALLAGNTVIAKPSSKTSLVARRLAELFVDAGLPENILAVATCKGSLINDVLLQDERVSGVAFTGSFKTAKRINQTLANRKSPIAPLIAETGGLNIMIVDSSALPEQVVKDVIGSAFLSAGQRCSALRVLIVQKEIRERIQSLLIQGMMELELGNPAVFSTDIPTVIDEAASKLLHSYIDVYRSKNKIIHQNKMPENLANGNYVAPVILEIETLAALSEEKFGPILHLMDFDAANLDELVDNINEMGFGLTLGIHSRVDETIERISSNVNMGNIYINRNMVGATVGVQPFGGEGYSGTGPKAGGPNYLQRFCTEKTITTNTSAIGGDIALLVGD